MSFNPHPIIPQTREQAIQRDHLHGLSTRKPENPAMELARLRQAVKAHRIEMEAAGPLGVETDFTSEQVAIMARKHAADHALWAHLPENA